MAKTPTPDEFLPHVAWCLQERDAKGADSDTKPGHLIPTPRGGFPDDGKPIPFDTTQITSKTNRSQPKAGDPSHPITAEGHPPTVAFSGKDNGRDATEELSPTLRSMNHSGSHANCGGQVAIAIQGIGKRTGKSTSAIQHGSGIAVAGDPMFTLNASEQHGVATYATDVRRLTPRECERLQGFPDDYTLIPWSGKPAESCPDGPRYRALGNSMAVPCMEWIGLRIQVIDRTLYP